MALNAYTIYGAPLTQRKRSNDALDVQVLVDSEEPWLSHPARGATHAKTRFVPAQGEYDGNGILKSPGDALNSAFTKGKQPREVGSWYTSLPRRHTDTPVASDASKNASKSTPTPPIPSASSASPAPVLPESANQVTQTQLHHRGDWFKSKPANLQLGSIATLTLADMLRRDPPNVSNPHTPPVYYGIGPTNKGYEMLSKGGWKEGQPLGPRAGIGSAGPSRKRQQSPKQTPAVTAHHVEEKKKKEKWILLDTAMPKLIVPKGLGGPHAAVEIIDLTNSAEEEESSEEEEEDSEMFVKPDDASASSDASSEGDNVQPPPSSSNQTKAILTPIPVALKHDRKGLGLSKSKKLVTHSSLALRHHIQHGALDRRHHVSEMRRLERERLRGEFGRGKRAFARKAKEEQRKRDRLMEYMGL